jgi:hypothetical protein
LSHDRTTNLDVPIQKISHFVVGFR